MTRASIRIFIVIAVVAVAASVGAMADSSGQPAYAGLFRESLSRSYTVWNDATRDHMFSEAISRGYSVRNHAVRPHTFGEAISRSHTVLNDKPN